MEGFFPLGTWDAAARRAAQPTLVPRCGKCGLLKHCLSPKMPVDGEGRLKVLVVGEGPGEWEDKQGRPFVGNTGTHLREVCDSLEVDLRRDCWLTNSIICRATTKAGKNRTPTDLEVAYCRPNVLNAISDLKPVCIICLGGRAIQSVIGGLWKEKVGGVSRWAGWVVPCQKPNAWLCPTWHPSALLHEQNADARRLMDMYFEGHLRNAFAHARKGRPWKDVPDFASEVEIIHDVSEAADKIRAITKKGRPAAFDIETDRLKPDREDSWIRSCSISDGSETLSFPWHGPVLTAMTDFIRSDSPKLGWNIQMEERWMRRKLGVWVKKWGFDGMQGAHAADNRGGITSLKFQAFVRLGQGDYESPVKPYLRSKVKGGNEPNRIKELDLTALLKYGGLDAILEYEVDHILMELLGVKV